MDDCVFCAIVAGSAPASVVYEDETICSFLTIAPVNPGHLLVIPKQLVNALGIYHHRRSSHFRSACRRSHS